MPKITLPVLDPYASIERPVAVAIAKSIIPILTNQKDVVISFSGKADFQPLFGSRDGGNKDRDSFAPVTTTKLTIEASEEYEEQDLLTTTVHQKNNKRLFADPALGLHIAPVYIPTTGSLSLIYRCRDLKEAQATYDSFRTKYSENRREFVMQAKYEYSMPMQFMRILEEIHTLREKRGGYGETFKQWFDAHNSKKNTYITDQAGRNVIQAYRETQENITAYFDMTLPPQIQKVEGAVYTLEMEFKYTYEKPSVMAMTWPVVVHNQILPKKFRGDGVDKTFHRMEGDKSLFSENLQHFRDMAVYPQGAYRGVRIPYYDEWVNTQEYPDTHNIMTALLFYGESGIPTPVDLTKIPDYKLDPEVVAFMQAHPELITKYCQSPFMISVYENDVRISEEFVSLDSNMMLSINREIDVRKTYRLQITLLANLTVISNRNLDILRQYPELCTMILKALLPKETIQVKYIAGKLFPRDKFWEYVRMAHHTPAPYKNGVTQMLRLVGQFIIKTRV